MTRKPLSRGRGLLGTVGLTLAEELQAGRDGRGQVRLVALLRHEQRTLGRLDGVVEAAGLGVGRGEGVTATVPV